MATTVSDPAAAETATVGGVDMHQMVKQLQEEKQTHEAGIERLTLRELREKVRAKRARKPDNRHLDRLESWPFAYGLSRCTCGKALD